MVTEATSNNNEGELNEGNEPESEPESGIESEPQPQAAAPTGQPAPEEPPITEIRGLHIAETFDDLMSSPTSVTGQIEILLRNGFMRDEIIDAGFAKRSVETIASKLKTKFGREFGKLPPSAVAKTDPAVRMARAAKGGDMALIMDAIKLPSGDVEDIQKGITFGIGILLLGVRLVQEMSTIGIQQTKPLLDVARTMREGEIAAASKAAEAAGLAAAAGVAQAIGPEISAIKTKQDALSAASGRSSDNPMTDMMVNIMQPYMQQAMAKMMSAFVGNKSGGQIPPPTSNRPPSSSWPVEELE